MKLMSKFWMAFFTIALISCGGGQGDEDAEKPDYHIIHGTVEGGEGEEVLLVSFEDGKDKVVDSAKVVNGEFEVKTDTRALRQYILAVGREMPVVLFLDKYADDIYVDGKMPGFGENYTITGSKPSSEVKEYLEFLRPMYPYESSLHGELKALTMNDSVRFAEILETLDSISAVQRDYAIHKIEEDSTCPSRWMLLREFFPASGLANFDSTDLRYFQRVANGMRSRYPDSEYPDFIEKDIASLQAQITELHNPTPPVAENAPFVYAPEIELNDVNGKPLSLSSLRGKIVLIDFWASWCKPCRMENPTVVKTYEKYKDKGFAIYSVSLDTDKDSWMKAIQDDNLSWSNHVSDLKGWQSPVVSEYGVSAIPATFLIDKDGKVIGVNLRGQLLEQKLQEILG